MVVYEIYLYIIISHIKEILIRRVSTVKYKGANIIISELKNMP